MLSQNIKLSSEMLGVQHTTLTDGSATLMGMKHNERLKNSRFFAAGGRIEPSVGGPLVRADSDSLMNIVIYKLFICTFVHSPVFIHSSIHS